MTYLKLAAAAVAASVSFSAAASSPFSDMYVFGDSLFDSGNIEEGLRFTNRIGPDYQNSPYGPVSPMIGASELGLTVDPSELGGTNYAVGGHLTADVLASITARTTYDAPAGTFNSYFYDLRREGRELDTRALFLLDGGGNDIPEFVPADVVSSNMVAAAQALKERGAKYVIIVNVPDFGAAPAGIAIEGLVRPYIVDMNEQILQKVGSDNILIFDTYKLVEEIAADPMSYGVGVSKEEFSFASFDADCATCTAGDPDAKIDGSNPNPDSFFFNDDRHPTTIGQQVTADYVLSVIKAPGEIAMLPEIGMDDMQAHWRAAHPVMRSNRWITTTDTGKYTVWGGGSYGESERDTDFGDTGTNEILQYDLGFNYRFSQSWYLGGMLSRAENELDFDDSDSSYDMESLSFSLISGVRGERWFLEGALSYSDLDYDDMKRSFSLGPALERTEQSDTSGETWGFLLNAGYNLLDSQKYRFGPMLGYDYINVEVDDYREKGDNVTALVVADQKTITGIWNLGAYGDMQLGFCDCTLYSEAVYQSFGRDGSNDPRIGLVSQPGNSAAMPGFERDDDGWRWDVGVTSRLSDSLEVAFEAGMDDADSTEGFWLGGQVSYSF